MKNKAIFLDRDGVINEERNYTHKIEDFFFYSDVFVALKKVPKDFKIIVITNQAGIAKGKYEEKDYRILNDWMLNEFSKNGVMIDATYFCPHHIDGTVKKYRIDCECRKPKIGMLKAAEKDLNLDLEKCWVIGDKTIDIKTGENAGCQTILVKTGYGGSDKIENVEPDFVAENLNEAIRIMLALEPK